MFSRAKLEEQEKKVFDLTHWAQMFKKAKQHRQNTWDAQARQCKAIRENNIPEKKKIADFEDYEGKFYKDNQVYKHIKWLVSMLSGSNIAYDMENVTAIRDENTEIFEKSLNDFSTKLTIAQKSAHTMYDCYYTGIGWSKISWNNKRISIGYETGVPVYEYIPTEKIFIDPDSEQPDKSDVRFVFHTEKYDLEYMKKKYPKLASKFQEKRLKQTEVVLLQYQRIHEMELVTIKDENKNKTWIIELAEWEDYQLSGKTAPEKVTVSAPYIGEVEQWYQVIFFPDLNEVIEYPVCVGNFCQYTPLCYSPQSKSAYPVGLAFYLKDVQEMLIILQTVLILQAFKYQRSKEQIIHGALVNETDYLENGHKAGVMPIVDPKWAEKNPHRDAVKPVPMPEFPQGLMLLSNMLSNSMKDLSGVSDVMAGKQTNSQVSGVLVAQLQTTGKVYHKEELLRFEQFLTNVGIKLMWLISENRDYPHFVQGIDESGSKIPLLVNDPNINSLTFEPERINLSTTINENIEIIKQIERETAMTLKQMGEISSRDFLEYMPITNPSRIYENNKKEKEQRDFATQIIELMDLDENFKNQVLSYMQNNQAS